MMLIILSLYSTALVALYIVCRSPIGDYELDNAGRVAASAMLFAIPPTVIAYAYALGWITP